MGDNLYRLPEHQGIAPETLASMHTPMLQRGKDPGIAGA